MLRFVIKLYEAGKRSRLSFPTTDLLLAFNEDGPAATPLGPVCFHRAVRDLPEDRIALSAALRSLERVGV